MLKYATRVIFTQGNEIVKLKQRKTFYCTKGGLFLSEIKQIILTNKIFGVIGKNHSSLLPKLLLTKKIFAGDPAFADTNIEPVRAFQG